MKKRSSHFRVLTAAMLFFALAFLLPAAAGGDSRLYLLAAAVPAVMLFYDLIPVRVFSLDRPALCMAMILCAFGILAPAASDPDAALVQGMHCAAGLMLLPAGAVLLRIFKPSFPSALGAGFCGIALLVPPLLYPEFSFPLTEAGLALLLLSVAAFLSFRIRAAALGIALFGLALLLLQKDLVSAAVWGVATVLIFWACSGSALWSGLSLLGAAAGGLCFGLLSRERLQPSALSSPLSGLSSMGWIGPQSVPDASASPDPELSFFLSLGEQYGLVLLLCVFLLMLLLLFRCSSVSQCARNSFHASLALGVLLLLGLRMLAVFLSLAGLIPPVAMDLPLLASSLPVLAGQMFLLGLLSGVSARNRADLEEDTHLAMLSR